MTMALPPVSRRLKRSASTASLPTPPRTRHRRSKGRTARGAYDTESDSDAVSDSDSEDKKGIKGRVGDNGNKKRRVGTSSAAEADEEAFWLSGHKSEGDVPNAGTELLKPAAEDQEKDAEKDADAKDKGPLLYRRRLAAAASTSSVGSAPVSPPPSNRRMVKRNHSKVLLSPRTPPQRQSQRLAAVSAKGKAKGMQGIFPQRDSPNNPFLVEGEEAEVAASPETTASGDPSPRTPKPERPTVTYVFRGVRGTFPNPLYDHEKNRPRSPSARSRLPVEDPDYSPSEHCPPVVLFPPAAPRKSRRLAGVARSLEEELRGRSLTSDAKGKGRVTGSPDRGSERGRTRERGRTMLRGRRGASVGDSDDAGSGDEDLDKEEQDLRLSIKPMKLDFAAVVGEK
ncbi:hypothetical protein H0H81_002139 [Sphagnurus paluster]|uniref:Uncharacterized protein n=1 Tax=Sphagnurus paluster TaxID=117069 RepID=A0A9P7GGW5_9AGAR|nr:hypothetical protein H0H81_002139 [Sphagnurus paluster]